MSNTQADYPSETTAGNTGLPSNIPQRGIEPFRVIFGDIPSGIAENLNSSIISCQVNYNMDLCTEIELKIVDQDTTNSASSFSAGTNAQSFAASNYFDIGRDVVYLSKTISKSEFNDNPDGSGTAKLAFTPLIMEVADVSVSQEQGVSLLFTIKCRTKAIQQMKRDKKPESINGNGTDYVRAAAKKFGLKFVGEKTTKSKKINKASGENEADSVWTVITNLAQQAKFKVFEVDGTLYFGSMKWLMYKWGSDAISYDAEIKNPTTGVKEKKRVTRRYVPIVPGEVGREFRAQSLPSMNKSDNSPMEATGSAQIDRTNGIALRPGMTVFVGGIPGFVGYYLITAVDFEERSPNPVGIQFQTPERRPKEKILNIPVGPMFPNTLDAVGPDVLVPYYLRRTTTPQYTGTSKRPPT